jgi:anaerobic selenocysteine-containing dehydrogenase
VFVGTQGWFNALSYPAAAGVARALKSPGIYGTMTIDQSAKWVAQARIGVFNGGPQRFDQADVWMLVGTNPLVSIMGGPATSGFAHLNPNKALRDAKSRGMKLIVIDPRDTETARHADLFLRPRPGEDAALLGGILHVVLREGWHDRAFCERHVDGLDALHAALAPFTPEAVSRRADVPAAQIVAAAQMFAGTARRGMVGTGTGTDMGPHSNAAEHLAQCLNVVCGRFLREGDRIPNPGVLLPYEPRHADVTPAHRSWSTGPVSRRLGLGRMYGQMMSADLADEMLLPGPDRLRALICVGGNPAVALPDQAKAVAALKSLDLLVTLDPRLSATARLAHYVIAPTLALERHDHTGFLETHYQQPFGRYAEPVVAPPSGAEVIDEWAFFWNVASRMGVPMRLGDLQCGTAAAPDTEQVIASMAKNSRVPLAEVRSRPGGAVFDADCRVQPARPGHDAKLEVAASDVLSEVACVAALLPERRAVGEGRLLLTVRRLREFANSAMTDATISRERYPQNPAFVHPDDLARLGLSEGDAVRVASDAGSIGAIVRTDATMRPGTVSMAHCWGPGADDDTQVPESTARLVSSVRDLQAINGMPVMTAIEVTLEACPPGGMFFGG